MPEQPSESLRKALDEMDRMRKRGLAITRFVICLSIVFLTASIIMLLFSQNKWLGLACGIISLYGQIGAVGVNADAESNANTQRILKAVEAFSRKDPQV